MLNGITIAPDESVVWEGRPVRGAYILSAVNRSSLWALLLIPMGIGFARVGFTYLLQPSREVAGVRVMMLAFILVGIVTALIGFYLLIGRAIESALVYRNIAYVLTNKRVLIRQGLIGFSWESVELEDVRHTEIKMSLADRLFSSGTISLLTRAQGWEASRGGDRYYGMQKVPALVSLPESFSVQAMIREAAEPLKREL
jgi:hypothetical protein